MSSDIAIKVDNLGKCYQIFEQPRDRLKQFIMPRLQRLVGLSPKRYYREFWALKDISFEIKRGETVGIIGRNGSGKSTLLQMICGTLNPSAGYIQANGRIAALLELGSGFNPEFSGRENVYLNASVLGLSKEEIDARFEEIVAFADIKEFIEQPVKTYSSGMMLRLAFAVIAHVNADILIVDEALAVGDAFFTQKCMRFLRNFMKTGTVLFVSHDTAAVVNLCDRAMMLDRGVLVMEGGAKAVAERYLAALYEANQEVECISENNEKQEMKYDYRDMRESLVNGSTLRNDIEVFQFESRSTSESDFGVGGATIASVLISDSAGAPLSWIVGGEDVSLEIRGRASQDLFRPIVGFQFKDRLGQIIFADNTFLAYQHDAPHVSAGKQFVARFDFRMPVLPSGEYSIAAAIADGSQDSHVQHHWVHDALILRVHATSICHGLIGVAMRKMEIKVS